MANYEENEEVKEKVPETFFEKFENTVEPALKIIAYIILCFGILATIVTTIQAADSYYTSGLVVFLIFVGGLLGSYLIWAFIMFYLRIGANVNRIRKIMENKA